MTFAKEAWPFVLPFLALAVLAGLAGWWRAAIVLVALALLVLLFFRVPNRSAEADPDIVLAAANGVVTGIDIVSEPEIGAGSFRHIVTFLSVFNVHIQRAPVTGTVVSSRGREGKKVAAFRADAGEVNAGHLTVIRMSDGRLCGVRQLAGLVARRVVCYLEPEDSVTRGQVMGIIKFGSRVDLYLPEDATVLVQEGDRLSEGLTPVARLEAISEDR